MKIRNSKLKGIKWPESTTNLFASTSNWMDMEVKIVKIYSDKMLKNILMNLIKMDNSWFYFLMDLMNLEKEKIKY